MSISDIKNELDIGVAVKPIIQALRRKTSSSRLAWPTLQESVSETKQNKVAVICGRSTYFCFLRPLRDEAVCILRDHSFH